MIRRNPFAVAGLLTWLLAIAVPAIADPAPAPPDILILMPDQMRGDCLSILEHPVVRTPHMDRLAREGVLFRRAYATVASCIPARYAMLTGLYPQTSGVVGFRQRPIETPMLPQIFRDAGYRTALFGRSMHQSDGAQALGYQVAVKGSTYVEGDDYVQFLQERLPPETPLGRRLHQRGIRAMVAAMGVTYNHWEAEPWPLDDDWHPTSWVARQAHEFVEAAADEEPLFLTASFYAPHPPLFPPECYFEAYLQRELPPPARGAWVDWDSLTPQGGDGGRRRVLLQGEPLRRAQAGYFGLIEHLDDAVAPLIAAFTARSERAGRPWLIVLTSDHGEMLGDHGYFRKCEPYEGSANVPFVISGSPDWNFAAGSRSMQPVCLEDLMPTLADLAGIPCPPVDGVSLAPRLRGEAQVVRPWLHFEHAPTYADAQAFHALTDGRFKYIWRPTDGAEQLFDLKEDPLEERDLAREPARQELLEQWRQRMVRRLAPRPEGFSDGQSLIAGRPYRPLNPGVPRQERTDASLEDGT